MTLDKFRRSIDPVCLYKLGCDDVAFGIKMLSDDSPDELDCNERILSILFLTILFDAA